MVIKKSAQIRANLMQAFSPPLSKDCRPRQKEHRLSSRLRCRVLAKRTRYVALALILFTSLAWVNLSAAAGRVFSDSWEDGTTNQWAQADFRNKCNVVSNAVDGGSPHGGTKMLSCNWNGVVAWNDPASFESLELGTWSYSSEIFLRWWIRVDSDFRGGTGPKYFRIAQDQGGTVQSFMSLHTPDDTGKEQGGFYGLNNWIGSTFWGNVYLADGNWHKIELYWKAAAAGGIIRLWEDGKLSYQVTNADTSVGSLTPFYISSNWSGPSGCCDHDTTNHIYWDDFEIYSDTGSGATGFMADATINVSGSSSTAQTLPNAPTTLTVQ